MTIVKVSLAISEMSNAKPNTRTLHLTLQGFIELGYWLPFITLVPQ